jgi:phage shock protein A
MGIFSRLSDIINSNINAILDKAEDPEKIIRMIIQEMEDTLVEVRSSAARAIADQKDIDRKIRRLKEIEGEWERKAQLALSKGREDLAKAALVEKAETIETAKHLVTESARLSDALKHHEDDVVKLEAKLREAKAKKAAIDARMRSATNHLRVKRNLYDNRILDTFERFDRVETRIDRLEAEAEAFDIGRGRTLSDEINDLERNEEIEKELAALKSRMGKGGAAPVKSNPPAKMSGSVPATTIKERK